MEVNHETLRRLRIYLPRLTKMLFNKSLSHNCCYMHVPKSGGSSVHEALRATVPFNKYIGAIDAISTRRAASVIFANKNDRITLHEDGPHCEKLFNIREYQLLTYMAQEMGLVYGHFLFSERADEFFGSSYKYVTVLRDPVKRVISNYRAAKHIKYITDDFDAYLDSDVAKRHARVNLRYFSGIAEINDDCCEDALSRSKKNIEKFSVIGFVDNLELFCKQFKKHFTVMPKIYHYNSAKGDNIDLTQRQLKNIEKLCKYDIEIHKHALAHSKLV